MPFSGDGALAPRISAMTETPQDQAMETSTAPRAVVVPDKPALEGLEAKWGERWKADADLRLRPLPAARERLLDRHAAAHGERLAARRPRLLLHPHRPDRAVPADARQGGLLPHGLGRQRAADRAAGAELLRRPLRPVAALRGRLHPAGEAGPEASGPDQPAQLRRAVRAAGAGGRAGLRAALAHARPLGRLDPAPTRRRAPTPGRSASARSCATSPAARPTSPRRRRSGTSPTAPRSRRPRSRRGSTPAPTTGSPTTAPDGSPVVRRDDPPRADPVGGRADRAPRRRALPAAVRHHGHLAGLRRRDPGGRAPPGRDGQGRRHRHVLHLRRPHRRPVVARAEPSGPHRDRPRRPPRPRDAGLARRQRPRPPAYERLAGQDDLLRARGDGRHASRERRPRRRAEADHADGELLRAGRQAARDRRRPGSGTSATAAATTTSAPRCSSTAPRSPGCRRT